MCSIFAHPRYYLYGGLLQIHGIYIIYALKHIVFGTLVKKYFVNLQLIQITHKTKRLNRLNISNFLKCMKAEDRRKLIERVQTLEGITDDERAALLGLLCESKTYGLVWEDKPEDVEERLREELPVLIEDTDKAVIGGVNNLIINILTTQTI